jgi:hypothetical protein
MKAKGRTARITKINRAASPRHDLEHYCRDLDGWPRSWMGLEKDLPPGEKLVACFRPFLEALAASDLSPKAIQKHVDNSWSLGGEIVRNLNETPSLRRQSIEQILADRIDDEGGLLVYALDRKNRYSAPSTPPAGSFTVSSPMSRTEPVKSPTNFPDEAY